MPADTQRWSPERVLALASDATSASAGRGLAGASPWSGTGHDGGPTLVWGLCRGSGGTRYQTCVELAEPAFSCSCPSRKSPCKHALGLLLRWSAGEVAESETPPWVAQWAQARVGRHARASRATDSATTEASRARRAQRVEAGVAELERWLTDQARQGLASASRAGYPHWDVMAARMVDAQAPGLASAVRRLASVASTPDRLLAELGLIWLLVRGYRRLDELPPGLAATVRGRVGFPMSNEEVLAGPRTRDEWDVIGVRDEADERLTVRRAWLRGRRGRPALVLTFAPAGRALPIDLVPGTRLDADLCFYPGALPLRALVAQRYAEQVDGGEPTGAATVAEALDEYAAALAAEPWLERWPMVLRDVIPVSDEDGAWWLVDLAGAVLPLQLIDPWRLVAAAGGRPCTVSAEWSTRGLRPLAAWVSGRMVRP